MQSFKSQPSSIKLRFQRIISVSKNYDIEIFELQNIFILTLWGLWNTYFGFFHNIPEIFISPFPPRRYFGILAILIAIDSWRVFTNPTINHSSRKRVLALCAMFWAFVLCNFCYINFLTPGPPIYFAFTIGCILAYLRHTKDQLREEISCL